MKFLEMQDAARAAERADKLKQMQEMLLAALEEEETQKQQNAQVILVRMSNEDCSVAMPQHVPLSLPIPFCKQKPAF